VGQKRDVPAVLAQRIARTVLVDNVRGQTLAYGEADVQKARLTSEVLGVQGDVVTLRLEGETRTAGESSWSRRRDGEANVSTTQKRGQEMRLLGKATYDRKAQRFTAFEMVAVGTRFGSTQYNGRRDDLDPNPIGSAFTLAADSPTERVAPAHLRAYGWE
jgi:hypothetical protein